MFKKTLLAIMLTASTGVMAQEAQINDNTVDANSTIVVSDVIVDVSGAQANSTAVANNVDVTAETTTAPEFPVIVQINRGDVEATSVISATSITNASDLTITSTGVGNNVAIDGAEILQVDQDNIASISATSSLSAEVFSQSENLVTVGSTSVGNNLDGDILTQQPMVIQDNTGPITALSSVDVTNEITGAQGLDVLSTAVGNNASFADIQQLQTSQTNSAAITGTSLIRTDSLNGVGDINVGATAVGNNLNIAVGNGQ